MQTPDVNVLIYAHRQDAAYHLLAREWLEEAIRGGEGIVLFEHVLAGVVRVATNRSAFPDPTPLDRAFEFCEELLARPDVDIRGMTPGSWSVFRRICFESNVVGGPVSDAYLAALAMEHDLEFVTTDRDFLRFKDLRLRLLRP